MQIRGVIRYPSLSVVRKIFDIFTMASVLFSIGISNFSLYERQDFSNPILTEVPTSIRLIVGKVKHIRCPDMAH